jgi:flagellar motor switch/type III secretory pathway protein FliN
VELGPGSIIKFEKTCDEPLEVAVGDRTIAHGEVVKVGDKFGVRIAALVK